MLAQCLPGSICARRPQWPPPPDISTPCNPLPFSWAGFRNLLLRNWIWQKWCSFTSKISYKKTWEQRKRLLVVVSPSLITSCCVVKTLKAAYGWLAQERKPANNHVSELGSDLLRPANSHISELGSGLSSTVQSGIDLAQASSLVILSQRHLSRLSSDSWPRNDEMICLLF